MKNTINKRVPLTKREVQILDRVLNVLNAPLMSGILSANTMKTVKDLRKRLIRRREKENLPPLVFIYNHRFDRKTLQRFCKTLESFVNLNGLGVEWDKRQADHLLDRVRWIESRMPRRGRN